MSGFPLVSRQRKYSSSVLSIAAAAEIAGSTAILLYLPRFWPVGSLLLAFASIRVSILAERSRDASTGAWAELYNVLRVIALVLSALGFLSIIAGLFRLVIGASQGQ